MAARGGHSAALRALKSAPARAYTLWEAVGGVGDAEPAAGAGGGEGGGEGDGTGTGAHGANPAARGEVNAGYGGV